MGDFDACRFDFRIDNKNGLTPSKRKRAFKRSVYNTLFKCKICGNLFDSRPALLEHKVSHSEHPCTFCNEKFKKKTQLREHVNVDHYIDKLKAGYKSEYGRSKSDDIHGLSAMPPLIPPSNMDGRIDLLPPSMIGMPNFPFGRDAMATSSPVSTSPAENNSLLIDPDSEHMACISPHNMRLFTTSDGTNMDSVSPNTSRNNGNTVMNSPPQLFPGFPFGGLPTFSPSSSTFSNTSHAPSALQTAMASFFPFDQMAAATAKKPSIDSKGGIPSIKPPPQIYITDATPQSALKSPNMAAFSPGLSSIKDMMNTSNLSELSANSFSPNDDLPVFAPLAPKHSSRLTSVQDSVSPVNSIDMRTGSDSAFYSFSQSSIESLSPKLPNSILSNLQANHVKSDNPLSLLPKAAMPATTNVNSVTKSVLDSTSSAMTHLTQIPVAAAPSLNMQEPWQSTACDILDTANEENILQSAQNEKDSAANPTSSQSNIELPVAQPASAILPQTLDQALPLQPMGLINAAAAAPALQDGGAALPPGYMMMTLVVTSQPGGGISAVPLLPGYSYPMLPHALQSASASVNTTTHSSSLSVPPPLIAASPNAMPPCVLPAALVSPFAAAMKANGDINDLEPGEITKGHVNLSSQSENNEEGFVNRLPTIPITTANYIPQLPVVHPSTTQTSTNSLYTMSKVADYIQQQIMQKTVHAQLLSALTPGVMSSSTQNQPANTETNSQVLPGWNVPQLQLSPIGYNANQVKLPTYESVKTPFGKQLQQIDDVSDANINRPANNKRKQSCPSRTLLNSLAKATLDKDESMEITKGILADVSVGEIETPEEDGDDNKTPEQMDEDERAAALARFISQDGGLDNSFTNANSTTSSSNQQDSASGSGQYQCEMCELVCENVYMLNKHKARAHKTGSGLRKMVDRLWQTKKDKPRSRESSVTPTLQIVTDETCNIVAGTLSEAAEDAVADSNNLKNVDVDDPSTNDFIRDTARQVYLNMMTAAMKSSQYQQVMGVKAGNVNIPNVASAAVAASNKRDHSSNSGTMTVSECETNSGIFGHYRIKKPRVEDYCTFKFHTCKVCKQLFNSAEEMWDHALIHKELQRFKCASKGCGYTSVSREKLLKHKVMSHSTSQSSGHNGSVTGGSQINKVTDEFNISGQQQLHYACEFDGCDSVFFLPGELIKHVDSAHEKLQCPEDGCNMVFYNVGGLKSHQLTHLQDATVQATHQASQQQQKKEQNTCMFPMCGRLFNNEQELKEHMITHTVCQKPLVCPLCKYAAQQRSSMNWHMKSRHGLDKMKTNTNRTVYVDREGNMVSTFRTEYFTGEDYSDASSGGGDSYAAVKSRRLQDNLMDTTAAVSDGIQIMKNEPEEITVGDNNTIATTDGSVVVPPNMPYKSELVYINANHQDSNQDADNDQPLDFSMKKSAPLAKTQALGRSNTDGNSTLSESNNKTPVGIVQPFMHIPSGSATANYPFMNDGVDGCESPPLPQLVPMANPFTYLPQSSSPFLHSNSASPLSVSTNNTPCSTPTSTGSAADGQFFNFKLNAATKKGKKQRGSLSSNKNDEPISYPCKYCEQVFECAEMMWRHKLKEHPELAKIYCDTCRFETMDQMELQSHMMSTHGKEVGESKPFTCFICSKGYSSKLGINHHLMRHSEGGPPQFPCPYRGCDSILHSRGALGNHVKRVHLKPSAKQTVIDESKQVFYCDYPRCDRSFRESKHLRVHRMTHTDEKPLKCHVCDYSCRQRNSLNWHMKSKHGREKRVSVDGRTEYI